MEVAASDGHDVKVTVVETLVPQKDPESVFRFDLDSTVYATFGAHLTTRSEHVRKVTDEAGRAARVLARPGRGDRSCCGSPRPRTSP